MMRGLVHLGVVLAGFAGRFGSWQNHHEVLTGTSLPGNVFARDSPISEGRPGSCRTLPLAENLLAYGGMRPNRVRLRVFAVPSRLW